ncbi:aminotransferase class IV [Cyclobacterium jeungdonense]|uniref:branched-chain-amino-acid transaminase n=1 Tax=Cyclobacterium jeungdonense TaxID=708087 RepID=A0ABT8CBQ0_9BACT|nr:aminotransferase class IV [Cyclobacterium jeungdonense]MDN3689223.1 aminotransferase class IV [Cyclobacterium jeungdonense]
MVKGTHQAKEDPRNKDIQIFINGTFHARDQAKISVFDSGYLVGDGVWEAFRVHEGKLVFIDQHLDRLWQSAKVTGIDLPFSREALIDDIRKTLEVNDMHDHIHVRVMVTRGIKKTPSQDPRLTISGPNLVIIAEHKQAASESKNQGIRLFTSTFRRGSPDYLDPRLNCHSKLHEVQALIQAIEAGADEALMLDVNGFVSTCNATNFFMVKAGEVWTSTGQYCMNGITRSNVIQICESKKVPCYQKNFSLFDVYGADEAFVTGTFGGLTPVVNIDGKPIGGIEAGPVTRQLSTWYEELILQAIQP